MRRYRDLPLVWKLLVPSLIVMLVGGVAGGLLISRDLSSRSRALINERLLQASLKLRSQLQHRELYVLESVNLAANVEGMQAAVRRGDASATRALAESVLSLKTDLDVLVVAKPTGEALVEFAREQGERPSLRSSSTRWNRIGIAARALTGSRGHRFGSFERLNGRALLMVAGPVCSARSGCAPVGIAIAGVWLDRVTAADRDLASGDGGVAAYAADGVALLEAGTAPVSSPPMRLRSDQTVRRSGRVGDSDVSTMYSPLEIDGRPVATLAVTLPTERALAALRGTRIRLALVLIATLLGVAVVGWLASRLALRQVRPMLDSSRSLGRGRLAARAPVLGDDELGELARRFNEMAEQLQASHENLESLVAQRTEEIQRLLRERTEFFAALSHELRTPLAVILSRIKMMLSPSYRGGTDAALAIKESGEQLLALVNEMLDLARAEAGRVEVRLEDVDLRALVASMYPTIEGLASARDLTVTLDLPQDLPHAFGDERRLREVLMNIVDNAVKYTAPGGTIEIRFRAIDGAVAVDIADTGVGIPTDVGDRIYEPFYRVPGVQPQHGDAASGLGLALTKRLAEAQHASLSYRSRPGKGTTFTVTVPSVEVTKNGDTSARPSRGDARRSSARAPAS